MDFPGHILIFMYNVYRQQLYIQTELCDMR